MLRRLLFSIWLVLVLGGLSAELWKEFVGRNTFRDLVTFVGLSYEQNLPTWYSSSLLLLCAVNLALIAAEAHREQAKHRWHWSILSGIFFYISLDETVTLHEDLSGFFDLGGPLYYGWVIPASIFVLVVGLSYLPFLIHLEPPRRRQFILAGALYVGGALGVEFILGAWADHAGTKNLTYGLIDLVEESMEILGVTVFLLSLLEHRQVASLSEPGK